MEIIHLDEVDFRLAVTGQASCNPKVPRFICGAVMALLRAGAVISFPVIALIRPRLLAQTFLALWASGAGPVISAEPAEAGSEVELDEIHVTAPTDRVRQRDGHIPSAYLIRTNNVFVRLQDEVGIRLSLVREQAEIVFRRPSVARQLPDAGSDLARIHRRVPLEIRPDRLVTSGPSWVGDAGIVLAANVDDVDGLPAHIPFGPDVALVNLDHAVIRDSNFRTRLFVSNILHPRSRRCESELVLIDAWPEGTNPYVLLGGSTRSCAGAVRRREGDLLFADSIPDGLRQAVQELYDPIDARLSNRLGSEPANLFVVWWPDSPHEGYRLEPSLNRNSLLLFSGSMWQQGIDEARRGELRASFMRDQIERRIRESDWPGYFTRSAVDYLLLLTRTEEDRTTHQLLMEQLPAWLSGCAGWVLDHGAVVNSALDVPSVECGFVLQFVYDAVARAGSAGGRNIFDTWRKLLEESFRRDESGITPVHFLASSSEALRIVQGLVDGNVDWEKFAASLQEIGVRLDVVTSGSVPAFEVRLLEHFGD